jgi:hypothetical protein
VIDVEANGFALLVEIDIEAERDLARLHARDVLELDVEAVRFLGSNAASLVVLAEIAVKRGVQHLFLEIARGFQCVPCGAQGDRSTS